MTLIPYFFLRLRPAKNAVRYMGKKSRCRLPYHQDKKSLSVICQRLRLFVNTLTAVDKCSLPNRDDLMQLLIKTKNCKN